MTVRTLFPGFRSLRHKASVDISGLHLNNPGGKVQATILTRTGRHAFSARDKVTVKKSAASVKKPTSLVWTPTVVRSGPRSTPRRATRLTTWTSLPFVFYLFLYSVPSFHFHFLLSSSFISLLLTLSVFSSLSFLCLSLFNCLFLSYYLCLILSSYF